MICLVFIIRFNIRFNIYDFKGLQISNWKFTHIYITCKLLLNWVNPEWLESFEDWVSMATQMFQLSTLQDHEISLNDRLIEVGNVCDINSWWYHIGYIDTGDIWMLVT